MVSAAALTKEVVDRNRRKFFGHVLAGTTVAACRWRELNAAIYHEIKALNDKFQESPDGVYWDAVKKHFHLEDELVMMNNGTVGPIPKPVFNTMMENFEVQLKAPCDCYLFLPRKAAEVRPKLAEFIGASVDEVAITRNTTEGMNFIANGLELKEGDEIIMSSMEHPAGIHPWGLKAKRYGVQVKQFELNLPTRDTDEVVSAFKRQITPRTRVLSVSHAVYKSGLIAPLERAERSRSPARRAGSRRRRPRYRYARSRFARPGRRLLLFDSPQVAGLASRRRCALRPQGSSGQGLADHRQFRLRYLPDAVYVMDYLREKHNIVVRTIGSEGAPEHGVRISTHIYTSLKDVERVVEAVGDLSKKA